MRRAVLFFAMTVVGAAGGGRSPEHAFASVAPPPANSQQRLARNTPQLQDRALPPGHEIAAAAQYEALSTVPEIDVTYRPNGVPRSIRGKFGVVLTIGSAASNQSQAGQLVARLRPMLLAVGREELREISRESIDASSKVISIKFQQFIGGLPVQNAYVSAMTNLSGEVSFVLANFIPDFGRPSLSPVLSADAAMQIAVANLAKSFKKPFVYSSTPSAQLVFVTDSSRPGEAGLVLAWKLKGQLNGPHPIHELIVSAQDGRVISFEQPQHFFGTVDLTRFRGHLSVGREGIHDRMQAAEAHAGVPAARGCDLPAFSRLLP